MLLSLVTVLFHVTCFYIMPVFDNLRNHVGLPVGWLNAFESICALHLFIRCYFKKKKKANVLRF